MTLLALLLALLIGLSLGILGGGGSILTVPTLLYVARMPAKQAIAASLLVVGVTSLVGAWRHSRIGNVRGRVAAVFGALSFVGAFTSARLSTRVSGEAQIVVLAVVMVAAALSMLRGRREDAVPAGAPVRAVSPAIVAAALGVGMLTGLVGIGGGFLFVPALALFARLPIKEAVGTSTLVIAINSAGGLAGYGAHVALPWAWLALFTAVSVAGIVAGTRLVPHIPQRTLRRAFAAFLIVVGSAMLWDKGRALLRDHPAAEGQTTNEG
jgi:uncharacterized membrane protein YfcA